MAIEELLRSLFLLNGAELCGQTSKDAFLLRGDVGRGEHQHRVERVHDLLQSVFIRIPLCLNYRVCEMPPVSRWSCGATRVYVALWFFTFQIDDGRERRFASFTSPSIYEDSKNAPIQPSRKFFGVFSR